MRDTETKPSSLANDSSLTTIKRFSKPDLYTEILSHQQPSYRAKQIYRWIYKTGIQSYDDMTNIPKAFKEVLASHYPLEPLCLSHEHTSSDGTKKYLFSLYDGNAIEAVAIPSQNNQITVCCSTQVGCPMACAFCATGKEGFTRNLLPGEIAEQILFIRNRLSYPVTHVVCMGQGEPFLNYQNLMAALSIINDPEAIGIGARHITVSTCGIIPGIKRFSYEPYQFTLAVSLHSAIQETRDYLMPQCRSFPLPQLKQSLIEYIERTKRRVTFEYALIADINDSWEELQALQEFCKGMLCHINLIPLNHIEESAFHPSPQPRLIQWEKSLQNQGISTTIRKSKGSDIAGACGQLKNKVFP